MNNIEKTKNKKVNWIKGLDRIAILLVIPIAILGFFYFSNQYAKIKAKNVYLLEEDYLRAKEFKLYNAQTNVYDKELDELTKQSIALHICAKERIIKNGGDLKGELVNANLKQIGYVPTIEEQIIYLIPRKSKRYSVGILGSLVFSLIAALSIGLTTRSIRWIKKGFYERNNN